MREDLQKKIDQAIKLLKVASGDDVVEIAYSGGKDSDVILQLAKESGIKYRAIYRCTTIDPPYTLKHVKEMGVEILMPKKNFFKLIEEHGLPSRFRRFCCKFLKEYKVLDKCVMGLRKSESKKRNERYNEPTECRFYGSKKEHVNAIYPLLDWDDNDVRDFILDRGIKCAPLYYDEGGAFHVERRLGCMACPLKSKNKRISDFVEHPNLVKAYVKHQKIFRDTHPNANVNKNTQDVYEDVYLSIFEDSLAEHNENKHTLFGDMDYKAELERIFKIKL